MSCATAASTASPSDLNNEKLSRQLAQECIEELEENCGQGDGFACLSLAQLLKGPSDHFPFLQPHPERAAIFAIRACRNGEYRGCQSIDQYKVDLTKTREDHVMSRSRLHIQREIRRHMRKISNCYEQYPSSEDSFKGRVVAKFRINQRGYVDMVGVGSETDITDPRLNGCILRVVKKFRFQPTEDEWPTFVSYPFNFSVNNVPGNDA